MCKYDHIRPKCKHLHISPMCKYDHIMAIIRDSRSLGAALRAARVAAGLTQAQLAERSGVSRRTIISIENGHSAGEVGRILTIARALHQVVKLEPAPLTDELDDLLGATSD